MGIDEDGSWGHEPRRRQKVDYIHFNPVSGKWQLAKDDLSYHFSSARFYESGIDDFGFLKNIFTLFDGD